MRAQVLQTVGACAGAAGAGMFHPGAGLIVFGVFVMLVGLAIERDGS